MDVLGNQPINSAEQFWNDVRQIHRTQPSPVFFVHPYALNEAFGYPYGKTKRGAKKLWKKYGATISMNLILNHTKDVLEWERIEALQ